MFKLQYENYLQDSDEFRLKICRRLLPWLLVTSVMKVPSLSWIRGVRNKCIQLLIIRNTNVKMDKTRGEFVINTVFYTAWIYQIYTLPRIVHVYITSAFLIFPKGVSSLLLNLRPYIKEIFLSGNKDIHIRN